MALGLSHKYGLACALITEKITQLNQIVKFNALYDSASCPTPLNGINYPTPIT
jgi:hypothetical protein